MIVLRMIGVFVLEVLACALFAWTLSWLGVHDFLPSRLFPNDERGLGALLLCVLMLAFAFLVFDLIWIWKILV